MSVYFLLFIRNRRYDTIAPTGLPCHREPSIVLMSMDCPSVPLQTAFFIHCQVTMLFFTTFSTALFKWLSFYPSSDSFLYSLPGYNAILYYLFYCFIIQMIFLLSPSDSLLRWAPSCPAVAPTTKLTTSPPDTWRRLTWRGPSGTAPFRCSKSSNSETSGQCSGMGRWPDLSSKPIFFLNIL